MDPLSHLSNKAMADQLLPAMQAALTAQQPAHPLHTLPPPPYNAEAEHDADAYSEADSDDEDDDGPPISLTLNAAHHIRGNNNLIPMPAAPMCEASKLCAAMMAHLKASNEGSAAPLNADNAATATPNDAAVRPATSRRRPYCLNLMINCGTTVIGDRNVIGTTGLKPRSPQAGAASSSTSSSTSAASSSDTLVCAGAKRQAEDQPADEPVAKRTESVDTSSGS